MINHQRIHTYNTFKKFISENIIKYVNITMVDDTPVNYGGGYCEFEIKPTFYDGEEPEYQEDFKFNDVIYFTTYDKEDFIKNLKYYGGEKKVIFYNYDNIFIDKKENKRKQRERKLERVV